MFIKTAIASILMGCMCMTAIAFEGTFITHSIEGKSYVDKNGELRGLEHMGRRAFQLELVRELMINLNYSPREYQIFPFKRALFMLKSNQKPYVLLSISRTGEREQYGKWVGPLTKDTSYLYELKSAPTGIKNLEDAKSLPLCILSGGFMDTVEINRDFTKLHRSDFNSCFRMLLVKRMSLVQASKNDLVGILNSENINPELIRNTGIAIKESSNYMAFSHQISDKEVQRWQTALEQLKNSKRYKFLYELYFKPL